MKPLTPEREAELRREENMRLCKKIDGLEQRLAAVLATIERAKKKAERERASFDGRNYLYLVQEERDRLFASDEVRRVLRLLQRQVKRVTR